MILEELSKRHNEWVKIACKICGDVELAKDLVQDMYLKIYDAGKKWNDIRDKVEFYVYITLRNIFYNHCKYEKRYVDLYDCYVNDNKKASNYYIEDFKEAFNGLSWYHREMLLLNHVDKMSMRDISEFSYISVNHVFKACNTAKKLLKEKFNSKLNY